MQGDILLYLLYLDCVHILDSDYRHLTTEMVDFVQDEIVLLLSCSEPMQQCGFNHEIVWFCNIVKLCKIVR